MIEEYDHTQSVMDIFYINSEKILTAGAMFIIVLIGLFVMRKP